MRVTDVKWAKLAEMQSEGIPGRLKEAVHGTARALGKMSDLIRIIAMNKPQDQHAERDRHLSLLAGIKTNRKQELSCLCRSVRVVSRGLQRLDVNYRQLVESPGGRLA